MAAGGGLLTRNGRASVLGLALAPLLVLPAPDGAVFLGDQRHVAYTVVHAVEGDADTRASILGIGLEWRVVFPTPDGGLSAADRAQTKMAYRDFFDETEPSGDTAGPPRKKVKRRVILPNGMQFVGTQDEIDALLALQARARDVSRETPEEPEASERAAEPQQGATQTPRMPTELQAPTAPPESRIEEIRRALEEQDEDEAIIALLLTM